MSNDLKKRQLLFAGSTLLLIAFFSYAFYFVRGEIASAQAQYIAKFKDLVRLEAQQREANRLTKELIKDSEGLKAIKEEFIEQSYDNKLKLVIDIENAAKSAGLLYDLSITKELTRESIVEERARLARSRRQSQATTEEPLEEKFPSIVFNVKLEGTYSAIVDFMEKLQRLPYYSKMESFTIASKRVEAQGGAEAAIEFSVFTK